MAFQLPFKFSGNAVDATVDGRSRPSKMMDYDQPLVWVTLLLMLFGMVMVYSASIALPDSPKFRYLQDRNEYFLYRQAIFIACLDGGRPRSCSACRSRSGRRHAPMIFVGTLVLLVLVLIPGLGVSVNGARRWLSLKVFNGAAIRDHEDRRGAVRGRLHGAQAGVHAQADQGLRADGRGDRPGGRPAAAAGAGSGRVRRDRLHRHGHPVPGRDQHHLVRRHRRAAGRDLQRDHRALAVPPRAHVRLPRTRGKRTMPWTRPTS